MELAQAYVDNLTCSAVITVIVVFVSY